MHSVILQGNEMFKDAGFDYAICGGFALDMFAGKELRDHGDFDIMVFQEDKASVLQFIKEKGWRSFGRFMEEGRPITQHIFFEVEDITNDYWADCSNFWSVKDDCLGDVLHKLDRLQAIGDVYTYQSRKWHVLDKLEFIEFEFDMRQGNNYVLKKDPEIVRPMDKAILYRDGIPYLAPEIILFFKSDKFSSEHPQVKIKTASDFNAIMPLLPEESKQWLKNAIATVYPDGYEWLDGLL